MPRVMPGDPMGEPFYSEAEVKLLMARAVARVQRAARDTEADMRRFAAKDAEKVLNEVLEEFKTKGARAVPDAN